MDLFIAWDGDHIGRKVGQLALNDDEEGLRRVSQAIDAGNRLMAAWVNAALGAMVSYGGDEGRARIPATALADVERIRVQYAQAVGSPVSVGVGIKLSEADKALLSAKVRGGDQVMLYGPEVDRDLEQLQDQTEAQKLGDEYLIKSEKFGQAAFRHRSNGHIVPSGLIHDANFLPGGEDSIEHYESGFINKAGQFLTEAQARDVEKQQLKKDDESAGPKTNEAPTNNASAGGGYTPIHEAGGGGAPEPPMQEASEHSEGEAMQAMADETSSPEGSGAAADFESELHDHAQEQDKQDQDDEDAKKGKADARQKVLQILANVKQAAPQLEQLRDQAPDLYGVLMQMTQALIITSQGLLDDQDQQSDSEKVVEQKGSEDEQSSPDVSKAELPPQGLNPPAQPQLHNTLQGFTAGLKALPVGSPERGRFLTAHLSHPPIVQALQATPAGQQLHAKLLTHLNGKANAGFRPGATQVTAKKEDLEKVQSHLNLPVGATKDGKVKVRHEDGEAGWVSVRAGQVLSNDGHPVSSRNPGGH